MKFEVSRAGMLEGFQVVGSIISPRSVRPILKNVHMVVSSEGMATLMSTDLEVAMRYRVPLGKVDDEGEAVVEAGRVAAILRECTSDNVTFESDGSGKVRILSGRSKFVVLSENPEEFPPIPEFADEGAFGLDREKLVSLIRKTQFAVAREKSRFAFNGAKLDINGNEARMVATDGKRLAMKVEEIDNSDGIVASHIVPSRALGIFEKVLTEDDDTVRVTLDEKEIMIRTARAEISSRLVEGSFPNYKSVIPDDCPHAVRFDKEELMTAFKQAALLTSQETRSVKITFAKERAVLNSQALDAGEATIEIDAPGFKDEELTIAFNPDYVVEGLKTMDADEVTLEFSKPNRPAKILGEEEFVYVVMPVTLRNG